MWGAGAASLRLLQHTLWGSLAMWWALISGESHNSPRSLTSQCIHCPMHPLPKVSSLPNAFQPNVCMYSAQCIQPAQCIHCPMYPLPNVPLPNASRNFHGLHILRLKTLCSGRNVFLKGFMMIDDVKEGLQTLVLTLRTQTCRDRSSWSGPTSWCFKGSLTHPVDLFHILWIWLFVPPACRQECVEMCAQNCSRLRTENME